MSVVTGVIVITTLLTPTRPIKEHRIESGHPGITLSAGSKYFFSSLFSTEFLELLAEYSLRFSKACLFVVISSSVHVTVPGIHTRVANPAGCVGTQCWKLEDIPAANADIDVIVSAMILNVCEASPRVPSLNC